MKVIFETTRCIVREMTVEDLTELFEIYYEPHVTDYIEPLFPYQEEVVYTKAYIKQIYEVYGYGIWAVIDKQTGKLIGRAGIECREDSNKKEVEMGYLIAPKYQKQGIATEVCSQILEFVKDFLPGYRVICTVEEENVPSVKLLKKLGFQKISDGKKSIYEWSY